MADFHEVRFPEEISWGVTGGPRFKTDIVTFDSGKEQRNEKWQISRGKWDAATGLKTQEELDILLDFFRGRRGSAYGFRYKDHTDFRLEQEPLQNSADDTFVGDNTTTLFRVVAQYEPAGPNPEIRRIFKLRGGAGDPLVLLTKEVRVNGVPQTEGVDFTIDYNTGEVTFTVAPGVGIAADITIEFDVPARFDTDEMRVSLDDFDAHSWGQIPIVELNLLANP